MRFLLLSLVFFVSVAAAQDEEEKAKDFYHQGLFYGSLFYIDPDYISIVVKPKADEKLNRLANRPWRFYLDKYTKIFVDGDRVRKSDLIAGDKVAVRYWAENRLGIAEAVYVVFGEYDQRDYRRRINKGSGIKSRKKREGGPIEPGSKQAAPDVEF